MWEETVISASDRVFPGLSYHDRKKEFHDFGNQIKSCLPLQMALYFNVWAFPFWGIITIISLYDKYRRLSEIYRFVHVGALLVVGTSEAIRLYLGYCGNLMEKIPELACFWLISTLLQFPLLIYIFCDVQLLLSISERVINGIVITLLVTEIITGTITLRNTANHYAKRFYLAQLYRIDEKSEE